MRYPSAQAEGIQDICDREAASEKNYNTIQYLAKAGDIIGLQRELHLEPNKMVDITKVNAAVASMARLQGIKQSLNTSAQLVQKIDQNPAVTADEKRQLIDTIYGAMRHCST